MRPSGLSNVVWCLLVASVALTYMNVSPIFGQAAVRTFSPPKVSVEISGQEPLPPDVAAVVKFGHGAGGYDIEGRELPRPMWLEKPYYEFPFRVDYLRYVRFLACGYHDKTAVNVVMTAPSGQNSQFSYTLDTNGCWEYRFMWQYGNEFGIYTIRATHPDGDLESTWAVDYPLCPTARLISDNKQFVDGTDTTETVLMGFEPSQSLTLHFYNYAGRGAGGFPYLATRTVTTDNDGAIFLTLKTSRSAGFLASDIIIKIPDYENVWRPGAGGEASPYFTFVETRQAGRYPTYQISRGLDCSPVGRFAQVHPQARLYSKVDQVWSPTDTVDSGTLVEILETQFDLEEQHVVVWSHVRTEQGQDGWMRANDLLHITVMPMVGGRAVVNGRKYNENTLSYDENLPLNLSTELSSNTPLDIMPSKRVDLTLESGTPVILIKPASDSQSERNWFVATTSGLGGWASLRNLKLLPYAPIPSDQLPKTILDSKPASPSNDSQSAPLNIRAIAKANVRVWSLPDASQGEIVSTLPEGTALVIVQGPVQGVIIIATGQQGDWYQVKLPDSDQPLGWVWSERLTFQR